MPSQSTPPHSQSLVVTSHPRTMFVRSPRCHGRDSHQPSRPRPLVPSNFEIRKIYRLEKLDGHCQVARLDQTLIYSPKSMATEFLYQQIERVGISLCNAWSFLGGSRIVIRARVARCVPNRKGFGVHASWLTGSQLANSVFSLGTTVVLPFYTLMVFAPKAELTRKSMESSIPYVVLGLLYAYLLYLSWTPDTIRLMFSSRYLLPELPGIAKMFSSEMTLASAWIHLLVVDLFAARQVFRDGLKNDIETRHSVTLCLLFCPVGILSHAVTKALSQKTKTACHET